MSPQNDCDVTNAPPAGCAIPRRGVTTSRTERRPGHSGYSRALPCAALGPSVRDILDVDREYRVKAERGQLPLVSLPSPRVTAAVPVLHTRRHDWHFTVRYSGTQSGRSPLGNGDRVLVDFHDDAGHHDRALLMTEMRGRYRGRRVLQSCGAVDATDAMTVDHGPRSVGAMR